MEIRVCAIDSKDINMAILKIAQYHINNGDNVKWYEPMFDQDCDILYISKIFKFTNDLVYLPNNKIVRGGTGYDYDIKLPIEIENITETIQAQDLLYDNEKHSVLFTTRGCYRKCEFCIVPKKEGLAHDVEFTSIHKKSKFIRVYDNVFFGTKTWEKRIDKLKTYDVPIDFQGIDVRTITDDQAKKLGELKLKSVHIAWDFIKDEESVLKGIELLLKYVKPSVVSCYVLVGFNKEKINDYDIYRIDKISQYKITPFAMGYMDFEDKKFKKNKDVQEFCRWVNGYYFRRMKFHQFYKKG